jgi:hypothetical protein
LRLPGGASGEYLGPLALPLAFFSVYQHLQPPSDHNVLRDGGHAAHDDPTYEGDSGAELRVEDEEGVVLNADIWYLVFEQVRACLVSY